MTSMPGRYAAVVPCRQLSAVAADHDDLDLSSCSAGGFRADAQQLDDGRSHAPPLVKSQGIVVANKDSYHDVSRSQAIQGGFRAVQQQCPDPMPAFRRKDSEGLHLADPNSRRPCVAWPHEEMSKGVADSG